MPKAKAAAASAAKKPRATKTHKLAERFPSGEVLRSICKKEWTLGDVIGQGGFGLIYLASTEGSKVGPGAQFVVKIEPLGNGPLFCEMHFYQRVAKPDSIGSWISSRKLHYLGVPRYVASGQHIYKGVNYRFLVMERFSTDLQKLFEDSGKCFSRQTVFALGLRLIDALEFLHESGYTHADVKASNCLLGYKNGHTDNDSVYLVDFGLASKYQMDGKHKVYKEDPRKAHDGTIEFTSIDAHKGVEASRRSDLEILGFCLLQWLCGRLPWEDKLQDKTYVMNAKIRYMSDIPSLMKKCFPHGDVPAEIKTYLTQVKSLEYDERPDYNALRDVLRKGLSKLGVKDTWKLHLPVGKQSGGSASPKTPAKGRKRKLAGTDEVVSKAKMDSKSRAKSPANRVSSPDQNGTPVASTSGTPKPRAKTTTPKSKAKTVPKKQDKKTTPGGPPKPVGTKGKAVTPRGQAKTATPKARSKVPTKSPAASASSSRVTSPTNRTRTSKQTGARARVTSPASTDHDDKDDNDDDEPQAKKRRVRRKDIQMCETAVQTSPGLKLNR